MAYNFPTGPSINEIYSSGGRTFQWNGVQWVPVIVPTLNSAPVHISLSPPDSPAIGALWYNPTTQFLSLWSIVSVLPEWVSINQVPTPPPLAYVSSASPTNPEVGQLWYNPDTLTLSVWISGTPIGSWQSLISNVPPPPPVSQVVHVSVTPPLLPVEGTLWYNTAQSQLYIWVLSSWVVTTPNIAVQPTVQISSSPPANPSAGSLWYDPEDSDLALWYEDIDSSQWVSVIPSPLISSVPAGGLIGQVLTKNSDDNFDFSWAYSPSLNSLVSGLIDASIAGAGARAFVTDSATTVFGSLISGGGNNGVPVYSDGASWRVG